MNNKDKIKAYIKENRQATVKDLSDRLGISLSMTHRHLNDLVDEHVLRKIGSAPKVLYISTEVKEAPVQEDAVTDDASKKIIDKNFLLVTPQGEKMEGFSGFIQWCADRRYNVTAKALEYIALYKKYFVLRKTGLLNGTEKMRSTFGEDCCIDKVYYIDFYAWEIFGKTKLGQLLLYAKQSQDQKMIKEIAEIIHPYVGRLIERYRIGAIGYIPPTVKRSVQLMDVLEKNIHATVPELKIEKVVGEVRVPQKTLSKLNDRVQNAKATIFVTDKRVFDTVLLIDDAVGSGATFNEVAKKLKDQGVAKKVIGLAITGSIKGFDIISEV
jgi:phosphoribosylpyrophosphate synthetase